jgi:hypothetical protein
MAVAWATSALSLAEYAGRRPPLCPFPGTSGACPLAAHFSPRVTWPGLGNHVTVPIAADPESPFAVAQSRPIRSAKCRIRVDEHLYSAVQHAPFPLRQFRAGIPISQELDGVRDARLHDARHTAATTLLLLGIPERAVMDFMGWSNAAMVKRYAHVTARLRRDIAELLNTFLWASNETKNDTDTA